MIIGYSNGSEARCNTKEEAENEIVDTVVNSNFEVTIDFIDFEEGEIVYDVEWSIKLVEAD